MAPKDISWKGEYSSIFIVCLCVCVCVGGGGLECREGEVVRLMLWCCELHLSSLETTNELCLSSVRKTRAKNMSYF